LWISFFLIFQTYYNRAQESQFPSNFFQSVTIEFYKWRCAVYCYKKKDNIIGWRIWTYCLFYVGEQQPIRFFLNLSSCKPEHNIMENCSTFFNQISRHFLFLFSQSSSLLLHSYVCEPPQLLTHTSVVPKKKVKGKVHPDDII